MFGATLDYEHSVLNDYFGHWYGRILGLYATHHGSRTNWHCDIMVRNRYISLGIRQKVVGFNGVII